MSKLKNFINKISNNNRIFTAEDIGEMLGNEFSQNENAIDYQMKEVGIPRRGDLAGNSDVVFVHAYTKDDGTEVKAHYRSKPDGMTNNNFEYGNTTGGAAVMSMQEVTDYLKNVNNTKNADRPDARELMDISLSGFENLPQNRDYTVFQPDSAQHVNDVLNINESKGLKIPNNWHGVIYNQNSGFANRLSNSPELQEQVLQHYDKNTNTFKNNRIVIGFSKDKNLNYSIGHGTILNPSVDANGNFSGMLFDKYDYKLQNKKELPNDTIREYNNFMAIAQRIPIANNYYVIVPIKFKLGF